MITGAKVSELDEVQKLKGTEIIPIVDEGKNKVVRTNAFANKDDIPKTDDFVLVDDMNRYIAQSETAEKVSAAALLEHTNNIEGLKKIISGILEGSIVVTRLVAEELAINGAASCIIAEKVPSVAPDFIGQKYIDKKAKIAYIAVGDKSVSDWKPINVA